MFAYFSFLSHYRHMLVLFFVCLIIYILNITSYQVTEICNLFLAVYYFTVYMYHIFGL